MGDNLKAIDLGTNRTAKQVACGFYHTCALLDNDLIKCWGQGQYAQLGNGNTYAIGDHSWEMGDTLNYVDLGFGRTVKQLAVGSWHSCALLDDETIKCWGSGGYGQLGNEMSEEIGDNVGEMGNNLKAIDLGTERVAKQVASGGFHSCALLGDDSIKCWGSGVYGSLGLGSEQNYGLGPNEMGDSQPKSAFDPDFVVSYLLSVVHVAPNLLA